MSTSMNTDSIQLIKLSDSSAAREIWTDSIWNLLCTAYRDVAGGLHFATPDAMLEETQDWEILHDNGQVLATLLYKRKYGSKISALGVTTMENRRRDSAAKLGELIRQRLQ